MKRMPSSCPYRGTMTGHLKARLRTGREAREISTEKGMIDVANTLGRSKAIRIIKHFVSQPAGRWTVDSERILLFLKVSKEELKRKLMGVKWICPSSGSHALDQKDERWHWGKLKFLQEFLKANWKPIYSSTLSKFRDNSLALWRIYSQSCPYCSSSSNQK